MGAGGFRYSEKCVGKHLKVHYDPAYVLYALFCGMLGAFVGMTFVRYAKRSATNKHLAGYCGFIAAAGIALGGASIWSVHFLGVESLRLYDCKGHHVFESFELKLTLYSLVFSIFSTTVALHLAFGGPKTTKRRKQKRKHKSEYDELMAAADDDVESCASGASGGSHASEGSRASGSTAASKVTHTTEASRVSYASNAAESSNAATTFFEIELPLPYNKIKLKLQYLNWHRFFAASWALTCGAYLAPHYLILEAEQGPYVMHLHPKPICLNAVVACVAACVAIYVAIQTCVESTVRTEYSLRIVGSVLVTGVTATAHYSGMLGHEYEFKGHRGATPTAGWYTTYVAVDGPRVALIAVSVVAFELLIGQFLGDVVKEELQLKSEEAKKVLPDNVLEILEEVYDRIRGVDDGDVATYIPELGRADPDKFGIALCDLQGNIYTVGDCAQQATIQSVGKCMLYVLAMSDAGRVSVDHKVGEEPSGKAFNELAIDAKNRASNALINVGALVTASMLKGATAQDKYEGFERRLKRCVHASSNVHMDDAVYESEWATCDNNRGLVKELLARRVIEAPARDPQSRKNSVQSRKKSVQFEDHAPLLEAAAAVVPKKMDFGEVTLDAYTRACSLNVSCLDVAVMGATFANKGVNPVTKKKALNRDLVDHLITVMVSCGMYNGAGKWIVDVGIPAKSGVSGHLLCTVPGVCGIGIYSPRLDKNGNSRRGILVCEALSKDLNLHILKRKTRDDADACQA